jgi:hypothetical protein
MATVFAAEAAHDVARRIRDATRPLRPETEIGKEHLTVQEYLKMVADGGIEGDVRGMMPRRPTWSYQMSSGRLHYRETKAYQAWLTLVKERIIERGGYAPVFEQNLQVWRQLWRVLERVDVVVVVLDARHPLLHLPPALYLHITQTLNKPIVCVLNKVSPLPAHHPNPQQAHCLRPQEGMLFLPKSTKT